jgi:hypothetical protein
MLMLNAYLDETGHSRDEAQKFVGMAGLVAPVMNWEFFDPAKVLQYSTLSHEGVRFLERAV